MFKIPNYRLKDAHVAEESLKRIIRVVLYDKISKTAEIYNN